MSRYGDDYDDYDGPDFADPGGAQCTEGGEQAQPAQSAVSDCGKKNRLTPADRAQGYQCDTCADQAERGGY